VARLSAMPAGTRGRLWAMILLLVAAGGIYFLVAAPLLSGGSPASFWWQPRFSTSTPRARRS